MLFPLRAKMAAVSTVDRQVAAVLRRAGYAGNATTLVVGVSGGADSSTLLYSLHRLSDACGIKLHVAHLNHDFRGAEADDDARFVESLARELGLPVSIEKQDPIAYQQKHRISSFEQGAREMRYAFMAAVAQQVGAAAVAVGHTADDLAETVLLHLLRGAGLPGLRGMTELAPWPWPVGLTSPALFRPLLAVAKSATIEYCRELGRDFREDSGNSLFRFTRNRVRQDLMPRLAAEYNPRIREALVRLAHTSALELDYLEREAERVWPDVVISASSVSSGGAGPASITLDRAALAALHPALCRLVLRRAYVALAGDARRLRESHLKAMSDLAGGSSISAGGPGFTPVDLKTRSESDRAGGRRVGSMLDLPGGLRLRSAGGRLTLSNGPAERSGPYPPLEGEFPVRLPAEPGAESTTNIAGWRVTARVFPCGELPNLQTGDAFTAYLDLSDLGGNPLVRRRQPGDRFRPLGMAGVKKLQDFYVDARAPRPWRDGIPLLVTERGIAWVVGYRIAEWAKVKPDAPPDSPVLRLQFERR